MKISTAFRCAALLTALTGTALAQESRPLAVIDRSSYPEKIDSSEAFDRASKAEILAMITAFDTFGWQIDAVRKRTDVKFGNPENLEAWRGQFITRVLENLKQAQKACPEERGFPCNVSILIPDQIPKETADKLPKSHAAWWKESVAFHKTYLAELARLALLAPATPNESLRVEEGELLGDELKDREFLLTFDDGPTAEGGNTDKVATLLRDEKVSAAFFVLGDIFAQRLKKSTPEKMQAVYADHCIGNHGRDHLRLNKHPQWKDSIDFTQAQIRKVVTGAPLLVRPPQAQRTKEQAQYVMKNTGRVVLWNIDTADWHPSVSKERLLDRTLTLMLMERKGIVLFHDPQSKAAAALPDLLKVGQDTWLRWADCKQL